MPFEPGSCETHLHPAVKFAFSDLVALPDFSAGAMENWGLITFREGLLLADGLPEPGDASRQITVIAHELAHQQEFWEKKSQILTSTGSTLVFLCYSLAVKSCNLIDGIST
ncbi:hypothetical protein ANCDUO_03241 [Ancylostoma duodenale]|uniref:Peptidase M1 membrane alanine aminopeptidase domain-containing protein n=1 Tax=Ancylostoma duodenale TaxID=51022 RepID=A0A0C2H4G7_9BILA|nr:hypothetical protein ANCDUO_03241 [Ancylostoma duodenale]